MHYPVQHADDWREIGRISLIDRARAFMRNRRYRKRGKDPVGVDLVPINPATQPVGAKDVILICIAKNAAKYVPSFLAHYRALGIKRFAFVDDNSSDATRALLTQPDVDLFGSNVDFRRASGGLIWRDMLVAHYGRNRWYLSIDSDEYLVFPGCENRPLADFVADLERQGLKRSLAVMIDIYPDAPLGAAPRHEPPQAPPTDTCPLFDGDGYRLFHDTYCVAVRGGPRFRLFDADMRLNKFPLVFADAPTRFNGGSHHAPLPIYRNFSAVHAVLLHYKFPADAVQDFRDIAERGTHANGSGFYKSIVEHGAFGQDTDFRYPGSVAFKGSEALVDAGFMQDIRRDAGARTA